MKMNCTHQVHLWYHHRVRREENRRRSQSWLKSWKRKLSKRKHPLNYLTVKFLIPMLMLYWSKSWWWFASLAGKSWTNITKMKHWHWCVMTRLLMKHTSSGWPSQAFRDQMSLISTTQLRFWKFYSRWSSLTFYISRYSFILLWITLLNFAQIQCLMISCQTWLLGSLIS